MRVLPRFLKSREYASMIEFTWIGIENSGKKICGRVCAKNKKAALAILAENQTIILSLKRKLLLKCKRKMSATTLLNFTEELCLLLQTDIMLSDALRLMQNIQQHAMTALPLKELENDLSTGLSFAQALQKHAPLFSDYYIHMISAGEQSGALHTALQHLIQHHKQWVDTQQKITKALFYPCIVISVTILICIGLMVFVIPQFSQIYAGFNAKLPTTTAFILACSQAMRAHGFLIGSSVSALYFLFRKYCSFKGIFNSVSQLPIFSRFFRIQQVMQWSEIMTMSLHNQIPLIDAMTLANAHLWQAKTQQQLHHAKESVIAGDKLAHALQQHCPNFPLHARHFIAIGENADALPQMMEKVAHFYRTQFTTQLDRFSKLIEPLVMMFVASLVSWLIIAMYLPVFEMGRVV